MDAMITSGERKSSWLVGGFPTELRVARVAVAPPETYRSLIHREEWTAAERLEGDRRAEHVAGRVAARVALEALVGAEAAARAVVGRGEDGAPELSGLPDAPSVSISHTGGAAVAVAAHATCLGIDVCEYAKAMRVRRVVVRFVVPEETALAERGGVARWIALWALKEAGAKAVRRGLLGGGLRATCLASIDPPRFAWPALDAAVAYTAGDVIAVVYKL
jgi:4'-phosphopantetheinyl transferase EntD